MPIPNGENLAARARRHAEKCADYCVPEAIKARGDKTARDHVCMKLQQEMVNFATEQNEILQWEAEDCRRKADRANEKVDQVRKALEFYADPANWTETGLKAAALAAYDIKDEDGNIEEKAEPHTVAARVLERLG